MKSIHLTLIASLFILPVTTASTIVIFPSTAIAQTQNDYTGVAKQVDEIAQQITVLITSKNSGNGSGAIVAKEGNTYYVLTAAHVVQNPDSYNLVAPDGTTYQLDASQMTVLPEVDLAIVKFTAEKTYSVATLAKYNLKDSFWVFVSGFPKSMQGKQLQRLLTAGIIAKQEEADFRVKDQYSLSSGGRGLVYTSLSMAGMSGGPILDSRGYVVGINTAAENELEVTSDGQAVEISMGFSLGVPIGTFVAQSDKTTVSSQWLQIETTSPPQLNASEVESIIASLGRVRIPDATASAVDWLNYGNQLWRLGRFDEAVSAFEKAISLQDNFYQAYYGKGLALLGAGKKSEALAVFEQTNQLAPNFPTAWRWKGNILRELKKYESALAAYDKAIALQPDNFVLHVERGFLLWEFKRFSEAITAYDSALKLKHHPWAYNNRALVYHDLKEYQKALADYNSALDLNPDLAIAYNNRGVVYSDLKDYQKALADYNSAITLNSEFADAYLNRGNVYKEFKEYQKALADYNSALSFNSNFAEAYYNCGIIYARLQEYQNAIANFDRSLSLNQNYTEAYLNRGNVYHALKDHQKALSDYNSALSLNPDYAEAYSNRGNVYADLNNPQKALLDYNSALSIDPNFAEVYYNRGIVYQQLQDYQSAIADFDRSISLATNDARVYNMRGITYAQLEDYQKAIADFNSALSIDPNFAEAYGNRAVVYLELEDRENAIADTKKAAELFCQQGSPSCQKAQELLRMIEGGGQ